MESEPVGIWIVGAFGTVATTMVVGARAVAAGIAPAIGLVSESPVLAKLGLAPIESLVFGGHEIRESSFDASAREISARNGSLHERWIDQLRDDLSRASEAVRPGIATGSGRAIESLVGGGVRGGVDATGRAAVQRVVRDLNAFRDKHGVKRLVVLNLASTEPPPPPATAEYEELTALEVRLDSSSASTFRPGLLYAYAALEAGAAFVNFTASRSSVCPAIDQFARKRQLPYSGSDGKTGETLVKSALAPMFRMRRIQVDSWAGFNILGNRDGQVLADEENRRSKVDSKDGVISGILGYTPQTVVGIQFVESLWDNKVAWDHIHFRGFLGYPMSMQFTWQGCDSILAAPLAIDLVRFADLALRRGESGPLRHLASFYKSPVGATEHDLHAQFALLERYVEQVLAK
jgi:myo-inositol-1-phosphate synthase